MARPVRSSNVVDVVGVGINAADTILRLPHFPDSNSKVAVLSSDVMLGGQVASAMVACRRWGLSARYIGKIARDAYGKLQVAEMDREGIEAHWIVSGGTSSQSSYILVDQRSGERTVLWNRDEAIALRPSDLKRAWLRRAKVLLVDGHDTRAAALAAGWARQGGIPVVGDFDNLYPGVNGLLQLVDFPVMSRAFPERLTGEKDLLKALKMIHKKFKCHLTASTLGRAGVVAWDGLRFIQGAGFQVKAVDTTGAGDIFHAGFIYGLVRGWQIKETLEFSCAAAALNCRRVGARGGIATLLEIGTLLRNGSRTTQEFPLRVLRHAAGKSARGPQRRFLR